MVISVINIIAVIVIIMIIAITKIIGNEKYNLLQNKRHLVFSEINTKDNYDKFNNLANYGNINN